MAGKTLESLEIRKAKDGSHHVRHEFERQPNHSKGQMGMYMERPNHEEHNFGPTEQEQHRLMTHIASALGFKKVAKAEGAEDEQMSESCD